jgi:tetratricopeptide (TPR) repeat protein
MRFSDASPRERNQYWLFVSFLLFSAIAPVAAGQMTQPNTPAPGAKLELSSASDAAKSEFWLGLDDHQNFTYTSGRKHFERAVALDPNFGLARVFAAAPSVGDGSPAAIAELDRGVADAARASTAEGVLALAWREAAFRRTAAATTLFRTAMDLMPNEPRMVSEYIWMLSNTDMKAALEAAKAGKAKFPNSGTISPALSFVLLQSGDTAAALAEAQRYTQVASTQPASFVVYGNLLVQQGRYDDAEAQFRHSLTFAPKHGDGGADGVVALASLLVQRGKIPAARQVVSDALQHTTSVVDSVTYLQMLAGASLYASDVAGAMNTYETASRLSGRANSGLMVFFPNAQLAITNAAFGDRKSISRYIAPIHASTADDSTQVEWWLATTYAYAGQADSALKYADKLAARGSNNPTVMRASHFMRGESYLTTRQCAKALDEFRHSDSTWVEVQAGKADCEMQAGHRAEALRYRDLVLNRRDINLYDPGEIRAHLRMSQLR